ncbi:hypothetical protein [Carboxylicivirga marina]|uniref:DUF4625 domain-containing protein n=1 Tax=Carboxylicivirga marina TaxID=2800988 RepID=A0ABS1HM02_9BACT|nr:hypothetical protein [Carboxylicivirga marina]MBK3518714.1 hypothetical protein [Carboxylicivirga marina]
MITKLTKTLALSLLLIGAIACGSDDEGPDTEGPTVVITTPVANQQFNKASGYMDLPLVAIFKDNKGLGKCDITIEYIEATPGKAALKGIGSPWTPAENGETHTINFNEERSKDVNEPQLFGVPIEAACTGGIYRLTLTMYDNAEVPNVSVETIDVEFISE